MRSIFDKLDAEKTKDIRVLRDFVAVYCRENHKNASSALFAMPGAETAMGTKEIRLCADCSKLLSHGIAKRLRCPYDPKPVCRKCKTHCYAPGYREKMRGVMKFSGMYLVRHGRLDLLLHYLK